MIYNSAQTADPLDRAEVAGTEYFASAKGVVFRHDVEHPLPPERLALVRRVDVLYSDPPWPAGWSEFHRRAGVTRHGTYPHFAEALEALIRQIGRPTYLWCSKRMAERFSTPRVMLRRAGVSGWLALAEGAEAPPPEVVTTGQLLAWLGRRHRAVYDCCCGYGTALRAFRYRVGSDIDAQCLTYVARELL